MWNDMFGVISLPEHHIHSISLQNDETGWFAPESIILKTHFVSIVIRCSNNVLHKKNGS